MTSKSLVSKTRLMPFAWPLGDRLTQRTAVVDAVAAAVPAPTAALLLQLLLLGARSFPIKLLPRAYRVSRAATPSRPQTAKLLQT